MAKDWRHDIRVHSEALDLPERQLVDVAIDQIDELVGTSSEEVVLHQDLHSGNVVKGRGGSWLAIDPKPLVGDPAFDAASLLRDRRDELWRDLNPQGRLRYRLDTLATLLDLDRRRLRGWGLDHALAWGSGELGVDEQLVACARWLAAID